MLWDRIHGTVGFVFKVIFTDSTNGIYHHQMSPPFGIICLVHFFQALNKQIQVYKSICFDCLVLVSYRDFGRWTSGWSIFSMISFNRVNTIDLVNSELQASKKKPKGMVVGKKYLQLLHMVGYLLPI